MSFDPLLLERIEAALLDADATIATGLGDHQDLTTARVWRGQVLVDWEPDQQAGGCLLRPALLRRLVALHARVDSESAPDGVSLVAPGRVLAALSSDHADLVRRLGGPRRVELVAHLRFNRDQQEYVGGDETYWLLERGQRSPLLRLTVDVRLRKGRGVRSA